MTPQPTSFPDPTRQPTAAALLAAVLVLSGCQPPSGPAEKAPPPPEVRATSVVQRTIPVTMDFSGTVQAIRQVEIIPRVSGYITERPFTEGSFVDGGVLLYQIDPRPFQASLDAAQAQLQQDQASLEFWKSEEERYTRLASQGAGSQEDKEKAIARHKEFRAKIASDQADIETARLNLEYTHVTAPFRGRVQSTQVNVGQLVQAQKDTLTTLVQIDPVYVIFNISRAQIYEIQRLKEKGLAPETLAGFKARVFLPNGDPFPEEGHVDYVSAAINPTTDTLEARTVFANPYDPGKGNIGLIVGQYVPLTLTVGKHPDALLIPGRALVQTQAGSHVYVVGNDDRITQRPVSPGGAHGDQWVINSGLKVGERVVTDGVQKVKGGMTVKVLPDPAPSGARGG